MKLSEDFQTILAHGIELARAAGADAVMLLLDEACDWSRLRSLTEDENVVVAVEHAQHAEEAVSAGLPVVLVETTEVPVYDKLSHALLNAIADELLKPASRVVAIYSGFEVNQLDSISVIDLDDHLGRLTVRDLQQLETRVPLDTLQTVVNLALEIGREGREGKPIGTLFIVGDVLRVRKFCHPAGFDPVKGYSRRERNLKAARVREGVKEFAQLDGAILVGPDGTVEAAAQYIDAPATDITLSKGLGARHWSAAAVTRVTKAVAVAVSQSSGTVRIFQNGEVVLRIEPFRRPMKWKEFEYEPPSE